MTKAAKIYDYDTERIPLVGSHTNRLAAATKDQIFYNVIPEAVKNALTDKTSIWLNKRGAFTGHTTLVAGAGRGLYYWARTSKTYTVIANKLYAGSSQTAILTLTTSTGTVWFTEVSGGTDYLILSDGTDIWTISTGDVVAEIVDADVPVGPLTPVGLDGYIFVTKSGTDEIWNSDLNIVTDWTATSYLSSEMYPDNLVALCRQVNYVVAFGTFSTEFFYDNATATGSPLRRTETVALKVGLASRDSLAQVDRRIVWVGQSDVGEASVWKFTGLTPEKVSNEFVDKILQNEGSNLSSARGDIIHHKGHTLYILNLNARSLAYDLDEKMWVDWSINSSGSHAVLPFNYFVQGANNAILCLHNTDGKIYTLVPGTYQDDAGAILVKIVTGRVDLGNTQQKRLFRLELIADIESSGTVTLDWSDDDYGTWSTSRSLDLTGRAYTKALGSFRRRAFRFQHSTNAPFRVEEMELDYSGGVH